MNDDEEEESEACVDVDLDDPMDLGHDDDNDTGPRVLTIQRLRPSLPARPPMTVLQDAAAGAFPFVYAAADTPPTGHALEKKLGSPVFCHLALWLLQPEGRGVEADIEWMARLLAYMRPAGRFELPTVSSGVDIAGFKRVAEEYQRSMPGMVLIAQEEGGQDWPNHGRIHMWVHAQQSQSMWHVLATLFSPAQWMGAPLFWASSRMEAALKDEPVYLEFWRATYARFQSRLNAL